MDFVLTRAGTDDAELLARMRVEMRKERENGVCPMPEDEFYRRNLQFFQEQIAAGTFISYIAWAGDQAAACSGLSIQIHPPTYENPSG